MPVPRFTMSNPPSQIDILLQRCVDHLLRHECISANKPIDAILNAYDYNAEFLGNLAHQILMEDNRTSADAKAECYLKIHFLRSCISLLHDLHEAQQANPLPAIQHIPPAVDIFAQYLLQNWDKAMMHITTCSAFSVNSLGVMADCYLIYCRQQENTAAPEGRYSQDYNDFACVLTGILAWADRLMAYKDFFELVKPPVSRPADLPEDDILESNGRALYAVYADMYKDLIEEDMGHGWQWRMEMLQSVKNDLFRKKGA